jgi:hypothetical protein
MAMMGVGSTAHAAMRWLAPTTLTAPSSVASEGADVASDPAGNAVAVWVREGVVQASVHLAGAGWSPPADLSTAGRVASAPQVELDAAGNALVVWAEALPSGVVLRYRTRPRGGPFSAPAPLSETGASAPQIAMSPSGAAAVVWLRAGAIQATTREDATQHFGLPVQLSDPAATTAAAGAHVAIDPAGDAVAVWTQATAGIPRIDSAVRPAGGEWAPFRTVTSGFDPDVTVAANGTATAVYYDGTRLRSATRLPVPSFTAGLWGAPDNVNEFPNFELGAPRVSVDADGTPLVLSKPKNGAEPALAVKALAGARDGLYLATFLVRPATSAAIAVSPRGGTVTYWAAAGWHSRARPPGGPFGPEIPGSPNGISVPGRLGVALDDEGNGVAVWQQQDAGGYTIRAAGLDAAPPALTDIAVPATAPLNTEIPMSVRTTDRWSDVKISWRFSDGDNGVGPEITHTFVASGTTELTIVARDAVGNAASITRTIDVPAPPVLTVLPPPDADRDGVQDALDCNDANAAIRPGLPEIPGNRVDENCDGHADPYPTVTGSAQLVTVLSGRDTRLLKLNIHQATVGDTVRLACRGSGCRRSIGRTIAVRRTQPTLSLTAYVRGVRLGHGAKLEIRIGHARRVARIYTFTMGVGRGGAPKQSLLCQAPGKKAVAAC